MKYHVVFSSEASDDLEEVLVYLAPEMGLEPAREYVGKIRSYCSGFSTFPNRGMRRDDIRPGFRLVGYRRKATIAFRIRGDTVTIVRIFHRGRNVEFDDESEDFS